MNIEKLRKVKDEEERLKNLKKEKLQEKFKQECNVNIMN